MLSSHRFYRRNRGNRSVKPLTASDEPDGAGTMRRKRAGRVAGTIAKFVNSPLHLLTRRIGNVRRMVDDPGYGLMAHSREFCHFEHRRTFFACIAPACHAPSPPAHYRCYFRLFYTQLRLALTDAIFQPFEQVVPRNSASRYAWRLTVYDWGLPQSAPIRFPCFRRRWPSAPRGVPAFRKRTR